jgi:6,7-dimethyl-8-ribityllumazine synthase
VSGKGSKRNESDQPAPFEQNPWPGQPGYQPLRAPRGSRNKPPAIPEPEPPADEAVVPEASAAADVSPLQAFTDPDSDPRPEPAPEPEPGPIAGALSSEHAAGDLLIPAGYRTIEGLPLGGGRNVGIAVSRFNGQVANGLLSSALAELERLGVSGDSVTIMPVPGAFELPLAAMALSKSRRYSCVIALGCVIRGETPHFEYVAGEAASGILLAGLETGVPVAFGVLTVDTIEQAESRLEKGAEAARSALEMADAFGRLRMTAGS